jgi:hypothetical protein
VFGVGKYLICLSSPPNISPSKGIAAAPSATVPAGPNLSNAPLIPDPGVF